MLYEATGIKAQNPADYIQRYPGNKETLAESLENVQRASAHGLATITPTKLMGPELATRTSLADS